MKVTKELPNVETLRHLGATALYLIAILPEEQKQAELKKAEEGNQSTVRELQKVKSQLTQEKQRSEALKNQLVAEQSKSQPEPVVKAETATKEVKPPDYDNLKSDNQ